MLDFEPYFFILMKISNGFIKPLITKVDEALQG